MDDIAKAYTVLELEPNASLADVNQAYKDLVFIWHPDRIPADNTRLRDKAQDKLKRLNDARSRLKQHLRDSKPASKYNPERYGRHRYRSYSQNRYTRPYGANGNGATSTATGNGERTSTYSQNASRTTNGYRSTSSSTNGSSAGSAAKHANSYRDTSNGANGYAAKNGAANGSSSNAAAKNGNGGSTANGNNSAYKAPYRHVSDNSYADYIYRAPQTSSYSPPQQTSPRRKPDTDLEGTDFKGANLKEKDFSGRNLSKSNLEGADLSDAFLHKVNLNQANLHKAKLFRANLLQANLSHANLRESNLIGADLSGSDLSGADLSGAIIGYGDKIMVKLTAARLTGTIMPNGNIHE
ncbi:MAG: pentapeptide repeat-containing protein [Leptolyngbyaceae cyanobacterium]